jgi:uncharacterized protein
MSVSMSALVLSQITRPLSNLSDILEKAKAHCEGRKIDQQAFMQARLFPDMLAFPRQVQIACDTAKFAVARLSDVEAPKFDDNEASFEQLQERISKTLQYVQSVAASTLDNTEAKTVTIPRRDGPMSMNGQDYVLRFVLPNIYFHTSTAYALLRQGGVEVGKGDFLGKLQ